jgi:hypothetical protein
MLRRRFLPDHVVPSIQDNPPVSLSAAPFHTLTGSVRQANIKHRRLRTSGFPAEPCISSFTSCGHCASAVEQALFRKLKRLEIILHTFINE